MEQLSTWWLLTIPVGLGCVFMMLFGIWYLLVWAEREREREEQEEPNLHKK
jgi:hypothetical protein